MLITRIIAIIAVGLIVCRGASAASHPLSGAFHDAEAGITWFDLVATLDWSPTAPDLETYLPALFQAASHHLFDITEGKHKLRRIYLFENDVEKEMCDIYFSENPGRANANVSAFGKALGRANMFSRFNEGDSPLTAEQNGRILGHELGHYLYGLLDEYNEESGQFDDQPYSPHSDDIACVCYMGNTFQQTELCLTAGHSLLTAQQRYYGAACWSTLTRDPQLDPPAAFMAAFFPRTWYEDLELPDPAPVAQTGGDDAVEIVFLEKPGIQVVSVIDRSGSMLGEKLIYAKSGANILTSLTHVGDRMGILAFNQFVQDIVMPPEGIDQDPPHPAFEGAVLPIVAEGTTALGDALQRAYLFLINSPVLQAEGITPNTDPQRTRAVVLLSDGLSNTGGDPETWIEFYQSQGITVHAVGLGEADWELLNNLTYATGGQLFYTETPTYLADLYAALAAEVSANDYLVDTGEDPFDSKGGTVKSFQWPVDAALGEVTFLASWGLDDAFQITLTTPSGAVITEDNAAGQGVAVAAYDQHAILFRVPAPEAGDWTMTASSLKEDGTLHYNVLARGDLEMERTEIQLVATALNRDLTYPEPLQLLATLTKDLPVTDATVTAEIRAPGGELIVLDLRDDGLQNDDLAADGIYSGALQDFQNRKDGFYDIVVRADNAARRALEVNTLQLLSPHGRDRSRPRLIEIPVREAFQRAARLQVRVLGIQGDTGANSRPESQPVPIDNTPTYGRIEVPGDVDYYQIAFPRGTRCTIRAAEVSHTMEALLQLYDPKERVVRRDLGSYGRDPNGGLASEIVWSSRTGGTYYVKVENNRRDETGNYTLYVRGDPDPNPLPEVPTETEVRDAGQALEGSFETADTDLDGRLSFGEALAVYAALDSPIFDAIDQDLDGAVTPDEASDAANLGAEGEGEGEGGGGGGGGPTPAGCPLLKSDQGNGIAAGNLMLAGLTVLVLAATRTVWRVS